jgi:phage terminase large subunit-like protein
MVTASRGKHVRAEPVAALYDQDLIRHREQFPLMEAELLMTTPGGYQGDDSPNRLDALVWAITDLKLSGTIYHINAMA